MNEITEKCNSYGIKPPKFDFLLQDPILMNEIKELILLNKFTELRNKINNEKITYIEFPDNITEIPDFAFFKCSTLKKIVTSIQLKTIGKYAFYCCHSLTKIFIPETVETVGKGAFSGCFKLEKINLPNIKIISEDIQTYLSTGNK